MEQTALKNDVVGLLETASDDELRALADRARGLLAERQNERRKHALAEIQRLAKEHSIAVTVKKPARKRGRPRKADGPAG